MFIPRGMLFCRRLRAAFISVSMLSLAAGQNAIAADLIINGGATETVSTPQSYDSVYVGQNSNGTLEVVSGGALTSTVTGWIGFTAAATGTATVSGSGVSWNSTNFVVGVSGNGSLLIEDGATASATTGTAIGQNANSVGAMTVTGDDSSFTTGTTYIGAMGTGTLDIADGASFTSTTAQISALAGGVGTVTVTGEGSSWTTGNNFRVGLVGSGTLNIEDGGTVTSNTSWVGVNAGSTGTVTVTGEGSTWSTGGNFIVGNSGTGILNIEDGGAVTTTTSTIIGNILDSSGTVTVTGEGSSLTTNDTYVAAGGSGELSILDGGAVTSTNSLIGLIGTGTATVSGEGSTWTSTSGNFTVGSNSTGTLSVEDEGQVISQTAVIGNAATAVGTATVTGSGSSWSNTGALTIGSLGAGTLTIADQGTVTSGSVLIAADATSTGTLNIGAGALDPAAAAGTLDVVSVGFGDGTGTIVFNHTSTDYRFDPTIVGDGAVNAKAGTTILSDIGSFTGDFTIDTAGTLGLDLTSDTSYDASHIFGTGTLAKLGDTTLELMGTSTFSGDTEVREGRLAVNGALASSIATVFGGGVLSGNGTVGGIVVENQGILAPGNSIGVMHVSGNYAALAGSIYQVELNSAGQSDLVEATGNAVISGGAVLQVVKLDPSMPYIVGTRYTVVDAAGGVTGKYVLAGDTVTGFYGLVDNYDLDHVYLDVVQVRDVADVGSTPNQHDTGTGVDSLPDSNPMKITILNLPNTGAAQEALDQLSGEIHASIMSGLLAGSRFSRGTAIERVRQSFCADDSASAIVALNPSGRPEPTCRRDRPSIWGHAYGWWSDTGGDGNAAALSQTVGGVLFGADMLVDDAVRLGLIGGYGRANYDVEVRNSSGTSDNYDLGIYGGTEVGNLRLAAGAVYSWNRISTDRTPRFIGFSDQLSASQDADTAQVFGDLGYRIVTSTATYEPFANLAYVHLDTGSFTEQGGEAALRSSGSNASATFSTLGMRASAPFAFAGVPVVARGALGWRHDYNAVVPATTMSFVSGSIPFTIYGVPLPRDAAVVELGLKAMIDAQSTLHLDYAGQFGDGTRDNGIFGTFTSNF